MSDTAAAAAADGTSRLFVALWPDEGARASLARWRDAWRWPPATRLVLPAHWHVTLHFLGAVPHARIASLSQALAVEAAPCPLSFGRPASWPGGVAVLEADEVPDPLRSLHGRLADALRREGLPLDARPWRPHVTLARHAAGGQAPDPADGALPDVRWTAHGHTLVASEGGRYRVLRTYDSSGAGRSPQFDASRG